jgi:DNA-directed RNA polymerase subunit RPC12/RpoP
MPIVVRCMKCGAEYPVKEKHAGKQFKCRHPGCDSVVTVPGVDEAGAAQQREQAPSSAVSATPPIAAVAPPGPRPVSPVDSVTCGHCGGLVASSPEFAGRVVQCPHCRGQIQMPGRPLVTAEAVQTAVIVEPLHAPAPSEPFGTFDAPRIHAPTKVCLFCAQLIQSEAIKCPHCGEILDAELRSARLMVEAQGDGIGLISIVCAALALTGTLAGLLCFLYGTLIGIPLAITGLILAVFATKYKKPALILNFIALLPAALLALVIAFVVLQAAKQANGPAAQPKQQGAPKASPKGPTELELADRLFAGGKREEAVRKYKSLFAFANNEEQTKMLKKIVEFEVAMNDLKEAKRWVEQGLDLGLSVAYSTPGTTKLLAQVQAERDQRAALAKKEREAEEARLKAEAAAKQDREREARAKKILADLGAGSAKTRREAIEAVDDLGDHVKLVAPALVAALADKDDRDAAFKALVGIGKPALPDLIKGLDHKNTFVRMYSARALGQLGPEASDAVPALTRALSDPVVNVRDWAKDALKKIKG